MRNRIAPSQPTGASLGWQAWLYANGKLQGPEACEFEQRLGEDQAARDALCQAVQLTAVLQDQTAPRPNPAYRDQVRRRLQARRGVWQWLTPGRLSRRHTMVWGGLGAVGALVALLLLVLFGYGSQVPSHWPSFAPQHAEVLPNPPSKPECLPATSRSLAGGAKPKRDCSLAIVPRKVPTKKADGDSGGATQSGSTANARAGRLPATLHATREGQPPKAKTKVPFKWPPRCPDAVPPAG